MSYASRATRPAPNLLARLGGVAAALLLPTLSSCALLVNGMTQTVQVTSRPAGAAVFVDGEPRGTTPVDIELRRDATSVVVVRMGSQQRTTIVTGRANGSLIALDAAPAAVFAAGTIAACSSSDEGYGAVIACAYLAAGTLLATAPILVDAGTGAWNELSPAEIAVDFD